MASSYSKTSVFDRQHVNEKPVKGVSFWKDAFLVTVFTRYVRTAGQTGEKKSHLKVETNTSLCGRGIKNGCFQISPFVFGYHGRFPFNISEISQRNDTFRLHRPDPSHRTFGYCSCKQDTKERDWGQQFCQMERDISVRPTEMTRPVKVDHLQSWSRIFGLHQTKMVRSIWKQADYSKISVALTHLLINSCICFGRQVYSPWICKFWSEKRVGNKYGLCLCLKRSKQKLSKMRTSFEHLAEIACGLHYRSVYMEKSGLW